MQKGVISACFKNFRKCRQFYGIVKAITEKLLVFSFKTFIGISELCDALVTSAFDNSSLKKAFHYLEYASSYMVHVYLKDLNSCDRIFENHHHH